jgi:aryl-alcohol dehydrogenase-like predicted oxidoreductase
MNTFRLPGLSTPCAPVALGFMDFATVDEASPLLDTFAERGGNLYDTAWIYNSGVTESVLGEWIERRGTRDDAVIIGKGAHTPECTPDAIAWQLDDSLDRLRTDHVDIYFLHRDNLDVPVGEFVDALDAEVRRGPIRGPVGGSNWTAERMDAAREYATENRRVVPSVLSNNFSLAEMQDVIWPGCVSSSGAEWQAWLASRDVTNFAWSSQSRGFFTGRAGRDRLDDAELVRVWYSDANFARRDRATQLAEELSVDPIHIALAYVCAQSFRQVPVIGPRTVDELTHSLWAFDLSLSAEQVSWLQG